MKALLTLLFFLCPMGLVQAYDPLAVEEKSDYVPPKPWQEDPVSVPESYDTDDLQAFTLQGDTDRFDYAIERKSLHTGEDGVTRFVIVINSRQGVSNSSYEGFRCGEREYKVYAYGSGRGLTPSPGGEWQPIPKTSGDYRAVLYDDLICNLLSGQANPPAAVFQAMRSGRKVATPFINSDRE
jgi:hypothetical protein